LTEPNCRPARSIGRSIRIGISREIDAALRLYVRRSLFVNGPVRPLS
jgi:hypothetical protein